MTWRLSQPRHSVTMNVPFVLAAQRYTVMQLKKNANHSICSCYDAVILCAAEQAIAQTPGLLISGPEELRVGAFVSLIEKLNGGAGCYLVAEENGACVGHALLNPMELIAISHVFRLTIVVHPGHSGKGIGTALMQQICDWAAPLYSSM
jgi:GNAT superfamily N-acetyltransferase